MLSKSTDKSTVGKYTCDRLISLISNIYSVVISIFILFSSITSGLQINSSVLLYNYCHFSLAFSILQIPVSEEPWSF